MVVAAAACERETEFRRVGLKDHARVIAEIADDAEVETHVFLDAVILEQTVNLTEIVERAAALLVEGQGIALFEEFFAAV